MQLKNTKNKSKKNPTHYTTFKSLSAVEPDEKISLPFKPVMMSSCVRSCLDVLPEARLTKIIFKKEKKGKYYKPIFFGDGRRIKFFSCACSFATLEKARVFTFWNFLISREGERDLDLESWELADCRPLTSEE